MKHRALSMLLALVMVVSLLPIAAIANGAEENTAAEERKETVEMRENDSQQGGDGEKSQLPTEENEKTAIQLYVEKKGGATSYTRYQYDENVRLPWLVYVNESDNAVVPAFLTFFQSTRNSAIYGKGQGVYNGCIFENYYCAIHSSEDCAPAWGGWSSVFYKNGTALHLDTDLGGNLEMVDNWFVGNSTAILMDDALEEIYFLQARQNRFVNNDCDLVNNCGKTMWMSQNFFYHAAGSEASWEPVLWEKVTAENSDDVIGLQLKRKGENGAILAENMPAFETTENYNALGADGNPQYLNFLPRFDGSSKTMAYPLARTQECVSFFYPNWRNPNFCPQWWSKNDPYYPSYVQQGVTISENELDGLRFSSYDSASDKAVGTFEFSASAAETEN